MTIRVIATPLLEYLTYHEEIRIDPLEEIRNLLHCTGYDPLAVVALYHCLSLLVPEKALFLLLQHMLFAGPRSTLLGVYHRLLRTRHPWYGRTVAGFSNYKRAATPCSIARLQSLRWLL